MKGGASGGGGGSGGLAGRMHSGGLGGAASLSEIEVRLEWKRGKKSKSSKKKHAKGGRKQGEYGDGEGEGEGTASRDVSRDVSLRKRHSLIASESSPMGSNTSLPVSETTSEMASAARKKKNRLSTGSRASVNEDPDVTLTNASKFGRGRSKAAAAQAEDDDGNDSDPEDSETPWTCTLKVRRLGISGLPNTAGSLPPPSSTPVKMKIATLSPTPHHPKVVAMLKVPYPLPDLEVQTLSLRKRPVGPPGSQVPNLGMGLDPTHGMVGLALRAEEVKDMVCSTGLWVVVREGFGGVGKVSRKGDGWRIRA
ncbi:hypothetical protein GYMLUDRAFT_38154 [Collybiopsis luxurians FD-317 M1]|nr:hypothetical protein GYMLUDRAFT_38154 [Collybiopsis luxurians FD-317 M1]